MKGNFILQARARFIGKGVNAHRKLGWMVRPSLDTSSPHINAVVHGDGLTSLQFRRATGGTTEESKSTLTGAEVIQLERRGDRFIMSVARFGQPFVTNDDRARRPQARRRGLCRTFRLLARCRGG